MQIDAAVIEEQGVKFAAVSVQPHVINNTAEANKMITDLEVSLFQGMPVILVDANHNPPRSFGRDDIVSFLSNVPIQALPWSRYNVTY